MSMATITTLRYNVVTSVGNFRLLRTVVYSGSIHLVLFRVHSFGFIRFPRSSFRVSQLAKKDSKTGSPISKAKTCLHSLAISNGRRFSFSKKSKLIAHTAYGPQREKTCHRGFTNITGADQPAHPRSLISAFVIRFLESIIRKLARVKFEFST